MPDNNTETKEEGEQEPKEDEQAEEDPHGYFTELEERVASFLHDIPDTVHEAFRRHRRTAFERHPLLFSTLGLLGVVATWHGFEGLLERSEYFSENPEVLLMLGFIVLATTGRLYRSMDEGVE